MKTALCSSRNFMLCLSRLSARVCLVGMGIYFMAGSFSFANTHNSPSAPNENPVEKMRRLASTISTKDPYRAPPPPGVGEKGMRDGADQLNIDCKELILVARPFEMSGTLRRTAGDGVFVMVEACHSRIKDSPVTAGLAAQAYQRINVEQAAVPMPVDNTYVIGAGTDAPAASSANTNASELVQ